MVRDYLAPALEGADPLTLEGAYARLDRAVRGYPYARCERARQKRGAARRDSPIRLVGRPGLEPWTR